MQLHPKHNPNQLTPNPKTQPKLPPNPNNNLTNPIPNKTSPRTTSPTIKNPHDANPISS